MNRLGYGRGFFTIIWGLFFVLVVTSSGGAIEKDDASRLFPRGRGNSYTISGKVTDGNQDPVVNVPVHICDLSKQPAILIPGGEGLDSLLEDQDGLAHLYQSMRKDGYQEGCNLFFASTVSAFKTREENRQALQGLLRAASDQLAGYYPNWHGRFDIIGHSFGGLIARFYLESAYYTADQSYGENGIHVDNLFTLGTPHGGAQVPDEMYPGVMFIAGEHIFNPEDIEEFLAVAQLYSYLMDAYNFTHTQPDGVRYHLFGGDFLQQDNVPLAVKLLYTPFAANPGDIAVSVRSAGQLGLNTQLHSRYPRTCLVFNNDMHGYSEALGLNVLDSYVKPDTTYMKFIRDVLGTSGSDCPPQANMVSGDRAQKLAYEAITGGDGAYAIEGLPAGEYVVIPFQTGKTFTPETRKVTLPPSTSDVSFVSHPGGPSLDEKVNIPFILANTADQ